ncbi:hypothetical protein GCM10009639_34940 [Kitasatospora putterlickiae]|uniref:Uncharacterized protein n=1 Tax=Kitasatospora putterlickiae TaxID=221725 RepID=A0ABN1Y499_9ACTN
MNATPEDLSRQAEREELARLLPAAAARGLSPHRHLLRKEHLLNAITEEQRPATAPRRPRLARRLALPFGLAVAAAGIALVALPGGQDGGPAGSTGSLGRITNVNYALEHTDDDVVTLTVQDSSKPVDTAQLQRDLDSLGVNSRVYVGDPNCQAAPPTPAPGPDDAANKDWLESRGWTMEGVVGTNRTVLSVRPDRIAAGTQLFLFFSHAPSGPAGELTMIAGLLVTPAPACMPVTAYQVPPAG